MRSKNIIITIISLLLITGAWAQWNIMTIDGTDNAGKGCRMVCDTSGKPHVFYIIDGGNGNDRGMYGRWTDWGWHLEQIFVSPNNFNVDPNNFNGTVGKDSKARVVWWEGYSGTWRLYYSDNIEGQWVNRQISNISMYYGQAIAVDTMDVAHILTYTGGRLEHWWHKPTSRDSWQSEVVDYSTGISRISMTTDGANHFYAAYIDGGDLQMAYYNGSVWATQTIDIGTNVGNYCGIDVDNEGDVHISYYDATNGDLKYAKGTVVYKDKNSIIKRKQ